MEKINNASRVSLEELTETAEIVRDITHNLDLSDPESKKIFYECSRRLLISLEGYYTSAYDDGRVIDQKEDKNLVKNIVAARKEIKGNISVGIGFNMDAVHKKGGREEWEKALEEVSFDDVYNGKIDLKIEEVEKLFSHNRKVRIKRLEKKYEGAWNKLRPNEQLGIFAPYFNGRGTVKPGTNFHTNMTAYVKTGDPEYLDRACKELTERSNPEKKDGLQKRRIIEALVLDSRKCPFYTVNDGQFPKEPKVVYAGKTRIPRGMPKSNSTEFSDFFVWRTCLDPKVRPEHWKKEGLIYRRSKMAAEDLPGGKHNCRCYAESVPNVAAIIEDKAMNTEKLVYKYISPEDSMMCVKCPEMGWVPLYEYVQKNKM